MPFALIDFMVLLINQCSTTGANPTDVLWISK